jgi:hypothetical protein
MATTTACPACGGERWAVREHESHVLHVDVDLTARRVERTWAETSQAAVLDATCDACGQVAPPDVARAVTEASRALRRPGTAA